MFGDLRLTQFIWAELVCGDSITDAVIVGRKAPADYVYALRAVFGSVQRQALFAGAMLAVMAGNPGSDCRRNVHRGVYQKRLGQAPLSMPHIVPTLCFHL